MGAYRNSRLRSGLRLAMRVHLRKVIWTIPIPGIQTRNPLVRSVMWNTRKLVRHLPHNICTSTDHHHVFFLHLQPKVKLKAMKRHCWRRRVFGRRALLV